MSNEAETLPTTQNILERINALAEEMRGGFEAVQHQLSQMDIRLDRIESFAHQTRSEVLALRADLKEFRSQFNQPA
jgi:predicted  nucleic acid-binding Zn-ribbon protein